MSLLILGLVLFLGVHSSRIFGDGWRDSMREALGVKGWKALYSLLSVLGLVLVVWGFSQARQQPIGLWFPPYGMHYAAWVLTLVAFVFMAAAYVPGNTIRAHVPHPMVLGVMLWALAHLLVNGNAAHLLLFGSFLLWGGLSFSAARRRDRESRQTYAAGTVTGTLITVVLGAAAWAAVAFWAHGLVMDIRPV